MAVSRMDPLEAVQGLSQKALVDQALAIDSADLSKAAIRELVRKRSPRRKAVLAEVATNEKQNADVRAMAALHLGRVNTADSREALLEVLSGSPDGVRRRAAEALGRIGDADSLTRLRRLRPKDPVVRRSVDNARSLISYRLGLGSDLLEPPPKRRLTAKQRRRPIKSTLPPATGKLVEEAIADAKHELPAFQLSAEGARHMICGANEFVFLLNRDVLQHKSLDGFNERNAVVMVVMWKASTLDYFEPYMYVLVHPQRAGHVKILGLRTMGEVTVGGEAKFDGQSASFEVHAGESPFQVPMDLAGNYDHEKKSIDFTTAVIDRGFFDNIKGSKLPRSG